MTPQWVVPADDTEVRSVPENAAPGSPLFTVSAADGDAGEDGSVRYTLLQPTTSPFVVHAELGIVTLERTLGRESQDSYTLVIEAKDSSLTQQKSSTTSLTVSVTDFNDHAPVCDSRPHLVIDSTVVPGDTLFTLTCSDADTVNGAMEFFKTGGDPVGVFSVDRGSGAVRLERQPTESSYTVTVEIRDGGTPELSSYLALTFITNNSLVFQNLPRTIEISEDLFLGSVVFDVSVSGTTLPVFFKADGANGAFKAEPSTGKVILASDLDRELVESYEVEITAWTAVGYTATSTLTVSILDINDNAPEISGNFNISVMEDLSVPSLLYTYSAKDDDFQENGTVTFSITQGNDHALFAMDPTGSLRLVSQLDAEVSKVHVLTILAEDGGSPALAEERVVVIAVLNVDEHQPVFLSGGGTISVPENAPLGAELIQLQGPDNDVTDDVWMGITSGNDANTFVLDRHSGSLYLAKLLDREQVEEYDLTIQTMNAKLETDTVQLTVMVNDVNDNPPSFSKSQYMFYVPHNTPGGTVVGQLIVADPDNGTNAEFDLDIVSGNTGNSFAVDGLSIVTATLIDYSHVCSYSLVVRATDTGSLTSETTVIVKVTPENISPRFLSSEDSRTVDENSLTGEMIYDLQATVDGAVEGESGDLTYFITMGNDLGLFFVDQFTGELYIVHDLDYEAASTHTITVQAENRNDASLSDVMNVTVHVSNVNDASPYFSQHEYLWEMDEGLPAGTSIGQVTAADSDEGAFGQVQYSLEPNTNFSVDQATGEVKVAGDVQYSDQTSHRFLVYASDNAGASSLTATAAILVRLNGVNKHAPTFPDAPYDVTVPESVTSGISVLVLLPLDGDAGANGRVTCGVTRGNEAGLFSIDPASCVLKTAGNLDAETQTEFTLTVSGSDGGSPSKVGEANVTVHVTDVNDNSPSFAESEVHVQVFRTAPAGTEVVTSQATDADSGSNGEVTYALLSGNDDGYFTVDPLTARVETVTQLTPAADAHTLILTATDGGLPARTGTLTINVDVTPFLVQPPAAFTFSVTEQSAAGTYVGTVPTDPSLSVTSYAIASGNYGDGFRISTDASGNGVLATNRVLDRETYPVYQLTVESFHSGGAETAVVTVTVSDKNDNAPEFLTTELSFPVVENLPAGMTVKKLEVVDADEGTNADVSLSFSPSSQICSLYLRVESDGSVVIKSPIDYEAVRSFQCDVLAVDGGSPALTSSTTLTVNVVDVNEQPIQVETSSTSVFLSLEIPHDSSAGRIVHTLTAADFGMVLSPGDVLEFVSVSEDGVFTVGVTSGEIAVSRPELLYDSSRYFQWVVCTRTGSGVSDTQLGMLRVDTFNTNDHLVAITYAVSKDYLESLKTTLESRLQLFFGADTRVEVLEVRALSSSGGTRRRLLADESVALVYVVGNTAADTAAAVDQAKIFLTQEQILQILQQSPDGAPVSGLSDAALPALLVMPYNNYNPGSEPEAFLDTAEGFALVLVLIALCVLVAVFVFLCCLWRIYKKRQRQQFARQPLLGKDSSNRHSRKDETKKKKSKSRGHAAYDAVGEGAVIPSAKASPQETTSHDEGLSKLLPLSLLATGNFPQTPPSSTVWIFENNQKVNAARTSVKKKQKQGKLRKSKKEFSAFVPDTEASTSQGAPEREDQSRNNDSTEAECEIKQDINESENSNGTRAESEEMRNNNRGRRNSKSPRGAWEDDTDLPTYVLASDVRTTSAEGSASVTDSPATPRSILIKSNQSAQQSPQRSFKDNRGDQSSYDDVSVDDLIPQDAKRDPTSEQWADRVKPGDTEKARRGSPGVMAGIFRSIGSWRKPVTDGKLPKRASMPDIGPTRQRERGSSPACSDKSPASFDSNDGIRRWLRDSTRFRDVYTRGGNSSTKKSATGSDDGTLRMRKPRRGSVDEKDLQQVILDESEEKKKEDRPENIPSVRRQSLFV
nr:hypothetical protein BaRGS_028122 [Batillaria attramentaria]